jgi:hypothetical protein
MPRVCKLNDEDRQFQHQQQQPPLAELAQLASLSGARYRLLSGIATGQATFGRIGYQGRIDAAIPLVMPRPAVGWMGMSRT